MVSKNSYAWVINLVIMEIPLEAITSGFILKDQTLQILEDGIMKERKLKRFALIMLVMEAPLLNAKVILHMVIENIILITVMLLEIGVSGYTLPIKILLTDSGISE